LCRLKIKELATTFYRALDVASGHARIRKPYEPTLADLEQKLEIGLGNIHHMVSEIGPSRSLETERLLQKFVSSVDLLSGQAEGIKELKSQLSQITQSSGFVQQADTLGVVSIHRNRLDAVEHEFFRRMQDEEEGIDIVGSTIFGLKGRSFATNEKILKLLHDKCQRPDFRLRILLTHWDHVSGRQAQEKTEKNVARYVISRELLDAVKALDKARDLSVRPLLPECADLFYHHLPQPEAHVAEPISVPA